MTRVYIAGPMTGLPEFNYPAFNAMAERLRALGYEVCNPAENPVPPCKSWRGYMRLALKQLVECDVIATLPNWETSRGARIEVGLARDLELSIVRAKELKAPAPGVICVKRFMLFAGNHHDHTAGGMREFVDFYNDAELARKFGTIQNRDWFQVLELETGEYIEYA